MPTISFIRRSLACAATLFACAKLQAQCEFDWIHGQWTAGPSAPACMTIWRADPGEPNTELLVVGGNFDAAGSAPLNHIAAWDGIEWTSIGSGLPGPVESVYCDGPTLYAAWRRSAPDYQYFTTIVRWNGESWVSLGAEFNSYVAALLVYEGRLTAGGWFTENGGRSTPGVARLEEGVWQSIGGGVRGEVRALESWQGKLVAGGIIHDPQTDTRKNLFSWDETAWAPVGGGVDSIVQDLAVHQGQLVVGGTFRTVGDGFPARGIIRWTGTRWEPFAPLPSDDYHSDVRSIDSRDGRLTIAMQGAGAAGELLCRLFRWNADRWDELPGSGISAEQSEIVEFRGEMVLRGLSGRFLSNPAAMLGVLRGGGWQSLGTGTGLNGHWGRMTNWRGRLHFGNEHAWDGVRLRPASETLPPGVDRYWNDSGTLYGVGYFEPPGMPSDDYPARWDGKAWTLLGDPIFGGLWFVGSFGNAPLLVSAGGRAHLLIWNGVSWTEIGDPLRDFFAMDATEFRGRLAVTGYFAWAGSTPAAGIALWDGQEWSALGSGLRGGGGYSLQTYQDELYVGGDFTSAGDVQSRGIAAWDGASWRSLNGGVQGAVYDLELFDESLIVAGYFSAAGSVAAQNIARWNSSGWSAVGSGTNGGVYDLALFNQQLVVSGDFSRAGSQPAGFWARFGRFCGPGDADCDGDTDPADIGPFVTALTDPAAFPAQIPGCDWLQSDTNQDGVVSVADIGAFVALIIGS